MIYNLKSIRDAQIQNKSVLLRVDTDVPIENSVVRDDSRLNAWQPTLRYLLENGAKVIIVGHLGRPEGKDEKLTLLPVAKWLDSKLQTQNSELKIIKIGEFDGWKLADKVAILENIRFYREEEKNDPEFAKRLALLAEFFVNDAFATAHRAHASTEGVAHFLPSFAGLRVLEEVNVLSEILENPKRPLCVIIGGAKIETKLPLVKKMHAFADFVLVGGTISGDEEMMLKVANEATVYKSILLLGDSIENKKDITLKSVENFIQVAKEAKTIVWNGPLGQIEEEEYQKGTQVLAEALIGIDAFKVVGGGDTVGFLKEHNLLSGFSFISTGGGAMLEFLSGEKLPGLVALEQK
jgi:phosphoglycerate kinase